MEKGGLSNEPSCERENGCFKGVGHICQLGLSFHSLSHGQSVALVSRGCRMASLPGGRHGEIGSCLSKLGAKQSVQDGAGNVLTCSQKAAATSVLCILERLGDIRSPGALLRKLAQKAGAGGRLLRTDSQGVDQPGKYGKLSAKNLKTT